MSHHGKQAGAGHYTADVKQPDGRWLRFDDASVTAVPSPAVSPLLACLIHYDHWKERKDILSPRRPLAAF